METTGDLKRMEQGSSEHRDRTLTSGSNDLGKPLLKDGSTGKPRPHHRHHHRSRREAPPNVGFVIFTTVVVALGPLSLGFAIGYTSPIQLAITKDLNLTVSEFSTFGSIMNVGCMLGAIASGRLADYLGRKRALLVAILPELLGWIIIIFAHTSTPMIVARVLVGLGAGIISFTVPIYIGETAPRRLRGSLGAMNQLATTIGIMMAYLCGLFVNWRVLAAFGTLPELVLALGLFFIPESPRWLAKVGQREAMRSSLQSLRGKDYDISNEIRDIQAAVDASSALPSMKWSDLKERKLYRPLLAGIGLMVFQQFGGINGVMLYSSAIFGSAGISNPNVASLALGALQVVMTIAAAGLMDKAGRRILLMVSAGGVALSSFLVGFSFYLRSLEDPKHMSDALNTFICMLALVNLLVYIASFSVGMGAIPWIIMSEIFPAHVKGAAGSVATLVNWLCAYIVTMVFNYLLLWSSAGSFWLFSAISLGTVGFVMFYVPETRGRTLEQIEASFS